jgi:cytoskeletal protein CcmA (bactofilin family)
MTETMKEVCNLAQGTVVEGDVLVKTSLRVEGEIKGQVNCHERLVCAPSSNIEGNVQCRSALIEGKLRGNITCTEDVHLSATAMLIGDIVCTQIHIEKGAVFIGRCQMQGPKA